MKDMFPGYYSYTEDEFKELWDKAIFVFDTNVLLNLYRYQTSTREALLKVLESIKDRIWIPHHVALEYQRNRLSTIAGQYNKFIEVRKIITNHVDDIRDELKKLDLEKRHSLLNPEELNKQINKLEKDLTDELSKLQERSISIHKDDEIRSKIESLFEGNIGNPCDTQDELDELFKEGEIRYAMEYPPGYQYDKKSPEFCFNGLLYKGKFGDLILWKQIIKHFTNGKDGHKYLILITDDSKEEWWLKVSGETISPRPELIEEILRLTSLEMFYMYNPTSFLKYAKKMINADVSEEAIKEVRDVSSEHMMKLLESGRSYGYIAEIAVSQWLKNEYSNAVIEHEGRYTFDFIVYNNDNKVGVEVKCFDRCIPGQILSSIRRIITAVNRKNMKFDKAIIVVVFTDSKFKDEFTKYLIDRISDVTDNTMFEVILGYLDNLKISDVNYGIDLKVKFVPAIFIRS